ncbi:MAG: hypothetical protein NT166_12550 [Candidatus Aminicenantes bacterium]|nr:hypothetical protein [Candidatus Aminicenantes bacterium]
MKFEIISDITNIETIAVGPGIRVLRYLRKTYGHGRWRKLKGAAAVRLPNGALRNVELHWYEAHGIGKRDIKIKRYLDEQ